MIIIAAIGLNSFTENKLKKIILSDADILRFNFSYRTIEENIEYIETATRVIDNLNANTKIMIDFPINKVRLGDFDIKIHSVKEGEEVIFKSAPYSPDCNEFIPIQIKNLGEQVKLNQTITMGDGEVALQVIEIINTATIKTKILNNGVIKFVKSFNIDSKPDQKKLLKQYEEIIIKTRKLHPDYLCISYIDDVKNKIEHLISSVYEYKKPKIIMKIENEHTINHIKEICKENFYNMIMLDRGEIAVNTPYQKLGLLQKQIIALAKKYKKPVIISTQILESTINNYTPSRSEILDLTNMILDGVSGIMLTYETAIGLRPAYSIYVAKKIIREIEKFKEIQKNNYETT